MSKARNPIAIAEEAEAAAAAKPKDVHSWLRVADLYLKAGNREKAGDVIAYAETLEIKGYTQLRTMSSLLGAVGRRDDAIERIRSAIEIRPKDCEPKIHLANLLIGAQRQREAARVLSECVSTPGYAARAWRMMSAVMMQLGRPDRAIESATRAAAMSPREVEYRIHLASLLAGRSRYSDALRELEHAETLAPNDHRIFRSRSGIREVLGDLRESLADAEKAVALSPDPSDESLLKHRDHVAELCGVLEASEDANTLLAELSRSRRPKKPRRTYVELTIFDLIQTRWRVIYAIILREMRTRFGSNRLGYLWAVFEPISHLGTLGLVFYILNHGKPPIGDNLFIYYITGLLPFLAFNHTALHLMQALNGAGALLQMPIIRSVDVIAARGLLGLATEIMVGIVVLILAGMVFGYAVPDDPLACMMALITLWLLAVGIGTINIVVVAFVPSWEAVFAAVLRVLYFASGIYYAPMMMPAFARDILAWNPVLQGIEWFRVGFYRGYEPHWVDRGYVVTIATIALLLGFSLERALRARIRQS